MESSNLHATHRKFNANLMLGQKILTWSIWGGESINESFVWSIDYFLSVLSKIKPVTRFQKFNRFTQCLMLTNFNLKGNNIQPYGYLKKLHVILDFGKLKKISMLLLTFQTCQDSSECKSLKKSSSISLLIACPRSKNFKEWCENKFITKIKTLLTKVMKRLKVLHL